MSISRSILLATTFVLASTQLSMADEDKRLPLTTVPKQLALSTGYILNFDDHLPNGQSLSHGGELFLSYLWQVSGLVEGWPSWVGFLTGLSYQPKTTGTNDTIVLEYGLLVKHVLFPTRIVRPYASYGLGAVQAFLPGIEGRGIGHLSRLSFGTEVLMSEGLNLSFELAYRYQSLHTFKLPSDAAKRDNSFQSLTFLVGLVLDFPGKA